MVFFAKSISAVDESDVNASWIATSAQTTTLFNASWEFDVDGICADGPGWQAVGHEYIDGGERGDQLPFGDFTPGRYAWLLDNIRPLEGPVPAKGTQGLRDIPGDVLPRVLAQLVGGPPWLTY